MRFYICFLLFLYVNAKFSCHNIERIPVIHKNLDFSLFKRPVSFKRDTPYSDFSINLLKGSGLLQNQAASNSFNLAAGIWTELLKPTQMETSININVNLSVLRKGILGSTQIVELVGLYCGDNGILPEPLQSHADIDFPYCQNISYKLKSNNYFIGNMNFNKANLKALGLLNMDRDFGQIDGSIIFSTRFPFDYDLSDGLDPQKIDFLSVAMHELGHLLGFSSGVDDVDIGQPQFIPTILDLYRFDGNIIRPLDFIMDMRMADPTRPNHVFYDVLMQEYYRLSTGIRYGDGNQASHWGADELYNKYIGIMDPSLQTGESFSMTMADLTAFKSLGYSINNNMHPFLFYYTPNNPNPGDTLSIYSQLVFGNDIKCNFGDDTNIILGTRNETKTGIIHCKVPSPKPSFVSVSFYGSLYSNKLFL